MSKYEDTRIVTFKEDYAVNKVDKDGKPIMVDGKNAKIVYYKKDSQHAIHFSVVAKLEKNGASMKVEKFDRKAYVTDQKEKLMKKQSGQVSVERR
jgi:hypothetical protein